MALFPISAGAVSLSVAPPVVTDNYVQGVLRDAGNSVVRVATSGGAQYSNGLLLTSLGQVVYVDATAGLPAGVQFVNGLPLTATGALCVSTGPAAAWTNGLPFAANGALASGIALGPEMLVNGDFGAGATGWTVTNSDATHIATFSGGTLRFQSDTTSPQMFVMQAVPPLTAGKTYQVTVVVASYTSGSIKTDSFTPLASNIANGPGTFQFIGVANATGFSITRNSVNVDITLDSISVRECL